jgi:hypothetical protein
MGLLQVEKPKRIKVGNGPACLVGAVRFGTPFPMGLTARALRAKRREADRQRALARATIFAGKPCPSLRLFSSWVLRSLRNQLLLTVIVGGPHRHVGDAASQLMLSVGHTLLPASVLATSQESRE